MKRASGFGLGSIYSLSMALIVGISCTTPERSFGSRAVVVMDAAGAAGAGDDAGAAGIAGANDDAGSAGAAGSANQASAAGAAGSTDQAGAAGNSGTSGTSVVIAQGGTHTTNVEMGGNEASGGSADPPIGGAGMPPVAQAPSVGHLVISQVYGGGGNVGAPLKNDFIELHNPTAEGVLLTGMSVQYSGPMAMIWNVAVLPELWLPPGGFVLVQGAAGTLSTDASPLPTPDVVSGLALGSNAGKVALVASTLALLGDCPGEGVIDLVGYGSPSPNCFEGSAAAPPPSNLNAVIRVLGGCLDANDNASEFVSDTPAPRNSAAAPIACQ